MASSSFLLWQCWSPGLSGGSHCPTWIDILSLPLPAMSQVEGILISIDVFKNYLIHDGSILCQLAMDSSSNQGGCPACWMWTSSALATYCFSTASPQIESLTFVKVWMLCASGNWLMFNRQQIGSTDFGCHIFQQLHVQCETLFTEAGGRSYCKHAGPIRPRVAFNRRFNSMALTCNIGADWNKFVFNCCCLGCSSVCVR